MQPNKKIKINFIKRIGIRIKLLSRLQRHLLLQPWATSLPLTGLQPHWPPPWSSHGPSSAHPGAFAPAVSAACGACPSSGSGCISTSRSQPLCPQGGQPEAEGPTHGPGVLHLPVPPGVSYTSPACLLPTLCLPDKLEAPRRQGLSHGAITAHQALGAQPDSRGLFLPQGDVSKL